jgi:hypothetical protein
VCCLQVERLLPLCECVYAIKRFVETRSRIDHPKVAQVRRTAAGNRRQCSSISSSRVTAASNLAIGRYCCVLCTTVCRAHCVSRRFTKCAEFLLAYLPLLHAWYSTSRTRADMII